MFLRLLGLATVAACEPARRSAAPADGGPSPSDGAPDVLPDAVPDALPDAAPLDALPWRVWDPLRESLRSSPDHLPAAADRLVSGGDPEALLNFVRTAFRVVPDGLGGELGLTGRRWGERAVLRGGAGTPRELAELLASLYRRAGLEAEVVAGPVEARSEAELAAWLGRPVVRPFAPPLDETRLEDWTRALGLDAVPPPPVEVVDPSGSAAAALAASLWAAIPPEYPERAPTIGTRLRAVPLVRVVVDGQPRYANPVLPEVPFGESGTTEPPEPAPPVDGLPAVVVELVGRTTADPEAAQTLVRREWTLDEVAGRQVAVQCLPAMPLGRLAAQPLEQVRAFVPVIGVNGPELTVEAAVALGAQGDVITLDGDRISFPEGRIEVNGAPLRTPAGRGAAPDAARMARVAALEVVARAGRFPRVDVRARALDSAGAVVDELTAADLRLAEDETGRTYTLTTDHAPPPRVLFLLDHSSSVPADLRGPGAAPVLRRIAEETLASHPGALFRASTVMVSGHHTWGDWTGDPAALQAQVEGAFGNSSDLWTGLAAVWQTGASVVVFLTDGEATDEPTSSRLGRIRSGPRAVCLHAAEPGNRDGLPTLERMAELTAGRVFDAGEPEAAAQAVRDALSEEGTIAYHLVYRAPIAGPETRTVTLTTADGRVRATTTYLVPPVEERPAPPGLVGLSLAVTIGERTVTRLLAGHPGGELDAARIPAFAAEVEAAVRGSVCLSFEGPAPTPSVWLDDVLTHKLALRPLIEALDRQEPALVEAALAQGMRAMPRNVLPLHAPLDPEGESSVFECGPRVFLERVTADVPGDRLVRRTDILPFTKFAAVGRPGPEAFRHTLERSLHLSLAESALHAVSAEKLLHAVPLLAMGPNARRVGDVLEGLDGATRARWDDLVRPYRPELRLLPTAAAPFAFWAIDPTTGSALAILDDGTGGGREETEALLHDIKDFLSLLGIFLSVGGAPWQLGVIITYGQTLATLYANAAVVIATLDAAGADEATQRAVYGLACSVLRTGLGRVLGPGARTINLFVKCLDFLLGQVGHDLGGACLGAL